MGGKAKQSQRTKNNVRPSSSGRSAELLGADPVAGIGKPFPALFPSLAVDTDAGLTPELMMCVKKLNKKDPITKTKALQELTELVKSVEVEEAAAVLPLWPRHYNVLAMDPDHKVRESAQVCHAALVGRCGRRVGPRLRALLGCWLQACYDPYAPAAAAANNSLQSTFPDAKLPEAILFCKTEVLAQLREGLAAGAAPPHLRSLSPSAAAAGRARLAACSLQGLRALAERLPPAAHDWLRLQLADLFEQSDFWALAQHKDDAVKAAWFSLCAVVVSRPAPAPAAARLRQLARVCLSAARQRSAAVTPAVFSLILVLLHNCKEMDVWADKKQELTQRILEVISDGGWGSAKQAAELLLPLLAGLPAEPALLAQLRDALFKGLEKTSIMVSKSERQIWLTSVAECLRYISIQPADECGELAAGGVRQWLRLALRGGEGLLRPSAAALGRLALYWLRQPPAERCHLLLRAFWHNIRAALLQDIDTLPADDEAIEGIIAAHTLLLTTLKTTFAQEPKKKPGIRFAGDDPAPPAEEKAVAGEAGEAWSEAAAGEARRELAGLVQEQCGAVLRRPAHDAALPALLPLVAAFDSAALFAALAGGGGLRALYDAALRPRLLSAPRESLVELLFIMMKHLSEDDQDYVFDSFKELPPRAVEWCLVRSWSHGAAAAGAARRWASSPAARGAALRLAASPSASVLVAHLSSNDPLLPEETALAVEELLAQRLRAARAAPRGGAPGGGGRALRGDEEEEPADVDGAARLAAQLLSARAGAGGAGGALAAALLELTLDRPQPWDGLSAMTRREAEAAWQDALQAGGAGAGAGGAAGAAGALRAAVDRDTESFDFMQVEHVASLVPRLLGAAPAASAERRAELDAALAAVLDFELPPPPRVSLCALRADCVRARLNCPFDDDNELIKIIVDTADDEVVPEINKRDLVLYSNRLVFRLAALRSLLLRDEEEEEDDEEEKGEEVHLSEAFVDALAHGLHDFAVLRSLKEGYAFWQHYDTIVSACGRAAHQARELARARPAAAAAALRARAARDGYYWAFAERYFFELCREVAGASTDDSATKTDDVTAAQADPDNVSGNGFFHTLQVSESSSPETALSPRCLVMLRCVALDAGALPPAPPPAPGEAPHVALTAVTAVLTAYYQNEEIMLMDTDIEAAPWRRAVSNAAVAECLAELVGGGAGGAGAAHWDFAALTACGLLASVARAKHPGCTKVSMVGRAALRLLSACSRCLAAPPPPHLAALPHEWRDVFAPDIQRSLQAIAANIAAGPHRNALSAPQAALMAALQTALPPLPLAAMGAVEAALQGALPSPAAEGAQPTHAHYAYTFLAHAMLKAMAANIVKEDTATVAEWAARGAEGGAEGEGGGGGGGGRGGEGGGRPRLALARLDGVLARLQAAAEAALADVRLGEATVSPAAAGAAGGALLGWLAAHAALLGAAAAAAGDLPLHYVQYYTASPHPAALMSLCLRLVPALDGPALAASAPLYDTPTRLSLDEPATPGLVPALAARVLYLLLAGPGAAGARGWWGCAARGPRAAAERVVRAAVAPPAARAQLRRLHELRHTLPDTEVVIRWSSWEVEARQQVEERCVVLQLRLAPAHPLAPPAAAAAAPAPLPPHLLHHYLAYQNGQVVDAVRMWAAALSRRVAAAPVCYVCYSRLTAARAELPRAVCHTCKNKFHAECLHKWFATSNKSSCPICRAAF